MKLKKRIAAALAIAVFCLCCFTGCHGSKGLPAFSVPEAFDDSRDYEITFWAKNDTNKAQTDLYHQAISDFEELYPNIHVNIRLYTDYGKIYNDVITNISTGTTPNVCITYPDHIATYLTGCNSVVALDDLFDDSRYGLAGSQLRYSSPSREELVPQFLEECSFQGHFYAIPYMRSTEACYVNKTFVEALGYTLPDVLTWDFVWEVSEAALAKNEDGTYRLNGQNVMIPFIYKSTDNMMIQMLHQLEAGYSTPEGEILVFNDTTQNLLHTVANHVKTGAFSTFKISSYPANFLNAGQCLFAVDSTAGATWMGAHAPLSDISEDKFVEFETAVLPVPQFNPDHPQMISQGPSICVFNKQDPQEVLASWLFAQFLLTDHIQISYAETEGYLPVTSRAQNSSEYQDYLSRAGEDDSHYYRIKIDASQLLLEHTQNTFITPVFNGSASLRNAAGQLIESTAKAVRRNQPVDDAAIQGFYQEVTSLYHLNQLQPVAQNVNQLGPLPVPSVILLSVLVLIWLLIIGYLVFSGIKSMVGKPWKRKH